VSIEVAAGELVGLIGPNGAGKTTFIDAVCGFTPSAGRVRVGGRDVTGWRPHRRARAGLARTFQAVELFEDLTVR
jgi:branched-chain amino acid transport system ATP-binding protein